MKKLFTLALAAIGSFYFGQGFTQIYKDRADLVLQSNLQTYNADLAAKGIRYVGGATPNSTYLANNNAAVNYIKDKLITFGYTDSDIQMHNIGTVSKPYYNLILTKTGTVNSDTYVIIGAHFDSVVAGVGANDNLSGVAAIMEAARILRTIDTEYSMKFIFFNAEENGLVGSTKYVSEIVTNNTPTTADDMKIKIMFNLDMIGGNKTLTNNTITCEADKVGNTTSGTVSTNDAASLAFTNDLIQYVGLYSDITGVLSNAYSSDYMPFENKGYVITGFYERMTNTSTGAIVEPNPTYHKATDNISNISYPYLLQTTKAALGALQHFAVADKSTVVLGASEATDLKDVVVYPNPAKNILNIKVPNTQKFEIRLMDATGKMIIVDKDKTQLDVSRIKNGVYYLILKTAKQSLMESVIINN
ncbi:hypothetical protein CBW16_01395 [Flavobacteriaceae bacterium JJC]|nr:hypothetical protein CBW16_01395 [Flavobacteriaceae bacterium JJC]